MSETLEGAAPTLPGAGDPNAGTGAATATAQTPSPPAEPSEQEAKEKKLTEYVVLISNAEEGPFTRVGLFAALGQKAAKKAAGEKLINDGKEGVAELYFTAVPSTSWSPELPSGVKLEPQITF